MMYVFMSGCTHRNVHTTCAVLTSRNVHSSEVCVMETWDGFTYGPLAVFHTEGRMISFGKTPRSLSYPQFAMLLRLMACRGMPITKRALTRGLAVRYPRMIIFALRKYLKRHLGQMARIILVRGFGYRLSLHGESFFLSSPV